MPSSSADPVVQSTPAGFTHRLSDFEYDLPPNLIAQSPSAERSASRLLHLDAAGCLHDRQFVNIRDCLRPGDLLVFNDTRVVPARLAARKASGGAVEILVERFEHLVPVVSPEITSDVAVEATCASSAATKASASRALDNDQAAYRSGVANHGFEADALLRVSKPPAPGSYLQLADGDTVYVKARDAAGHYRLAFTRPVLEVLHALGDVPLPPYIDRPTQADDPARYQTVYARHPGAVAAPTAGLHFDAAILAALSAAGIEHTFVTLHVGAGTFLPVRHDDLSQHRMHAEWFDLPEAAAQAVMATRARGGRVIAVGTTSVRCLESACLADGVARAGSGDTRLFITPGYQFRLVDALITNFHLPRSTLLMLVSAFAGMESIRRAYAHAIAARYRFFSYGDAMLIERPQGAAAL